MTCRMARVLLEENHHQGSPKERCSTSIHILDASEIEGPHVGPGSRAAPVTLAARSVIATAGIRETHREDPGKDIKMRGRHQDEKKGI
jgi:hypothetical protein